MLEYAAMGSNSGAIRRKAVRTGEEAGARPGRCPASRRGVAAAGRRYSYAQERTDALLRETQKDAGALVADFL